MAKESLSPTEGVALGRSSGLALGQSAIERLGSGGRLDSERSGKGLGTTFVYSQRFGAAFELLVADHETLVEHLGQVIHFERLQIALQRARPVADLLPVAAQSLA